MHIVELRLFGRAVAALGRGETRSTTASKRAVRLKTVTRAYDRRSIDGDQRRVGGRHGIAAQVLRAAPISAPDPRAAARNPPTCGRRRAASGGGSRHRVAGEGQGREAGRLDHDAELLVSSRISASSGRSPASTLPPGNSHRPASCLPSGRWAIRPGRRRRSAPPRPPGAVSGPIVAVDRDVVLGQVAGPHRGRGRGRCRHRR